MRRRRSRWPFVLIGAVAVLIGATLGMVASGVRPSSDLLAWLGGQAAGTASPAATDAVPTASTPRDSGAPPASGGGLGSAAPGSVSPGHSGSGGSATPGSPAPSRAPGSSAGSGTGATAPPGSSSPPGPSTGSAPQARPVYNGSRDKKVVALTFDDGYSPVALRQILAILKREQITATFFPYGWAVHQDPEGWHMVVAAGYPIANHTLTHTILTTLTADQVTTEMTRGRRTIDLYSGGRSVDLMRPPGGAFNAVTAKAIARAGYDTIVLWDVDTFDWQGPSASTILARAIKGTNGSIVLMHSGPPNTPKALPGIIANYRSRGFTFVTVPELLAAR